MAHDHLPLLPILQDLRFINGVNSDGGVSMTFRLSMPIDIVNRIAKLIAPYIAHRGHLDRAFPTSLKFKFILQIH